jgi:drug/metabolite transporter (DMT)-like permease
MTIETPTEKRHRRAVLQALLVTFLWSTSWVLIKIGLQDIPALTFAGLRYTLAFLCLLPFALRKYSQPNTVKLTGQQWGMLILLGVFYYAVVQGTQFLGLSFLPATMTSLILNFTSVFVAIMGILWLSERPGFWGWLGIALSVMGSLIYFYPVSISSLEWLGVGIVFMGMIANAGSAILGRYINSRQNLPAIWVTTISMGVGGLLLLLAGGLSQGVPVLSWQNWAIIAWLAVVNTALAFTLWNHTLRSLEAMESTIINSTMMLQIGLLAWLLLGEHLGVKEWSGMILAGIGAAVVQLRR